MMQTLLSMIEEVEAMDDEDLWRDPGGTKSRLLAIGQEILLNWYRAKNIEPVNEDYEGFLLLGLHRGAAKQDPTLNACRESCRELVYQCNTAEASDSVEDRARHFRLAAMVAKHLLLFFDGKLENEALGEFCCSSRGLRLKNLELS